MRQTSLYSDTPTPEQDAAYAALALAWEVHMQHQLGCQVVPAPASDAAALTLDLDHTVLTDAQEGGRP